MMEFPADKDGRIKSLTGVKVGDEFIVHSRGFGGLPLLVKCNKTTPKFAHIGQYRYKIENAAGYGGGQWTFPPYLHNATQEAVAELKEEHKKRERLNYVMDVNWRKVNSDIVAKVYDLIDETN